MPSFYEKPLFRYPIYALIALSIIIILISIYFNWLIGAIGVVLLAVILFFIKRADSLIRKEIDDYISTLSYRLKKVGEEALMEMPIGIMLFNDQYYIEWANPFLSSCFNESTLVGRSLYDTCEAVVPLIKQEVDSETITLNERKFKVVIKRDERLLYFFDVTEQIQIEKQYENERTVLAYIFLDNYDDVTQGLDDQTRSTMNSQVTSLLNAWAQEHGIFLKRTSSERFIAVLNEHILTELENAKFSILDEIREKTSVHTVSLTLSIGIGASVSSLKELGDLAQSSLDLALGRGGDQVAIKMPNGKVKFYGGKTNPMEKRTRVRARVISHALKEIVSESSNVIIMGHKFPDMDAVGAAIGILKVAQANGKEGYIVIDPNQIGSSVQRLIEEIKKYEELWSRFITPEEAMEISNDDTLLVVVDTHKPSLVMEERLMNKIEHIVVIDHHRRGEEFIKDPLLVYMEPYASSTAELVTELLEYQPKRLKINMIEATALLAGIIVDTKSFSLRTGSRTFDAASYLRAKGADTVLVQKVLKESVGSYIKRAKLIQHTALYKEHIAIASLPENEEEYFDQVLIAQAADSLLSMSEVEASFAVARRDEHTVCISARSLGEVNVQIIMEALDGGGHLTNAATQLSGISVSEALVRLKEAIDEYFEGGVQR
ncbi:MULTISPECIES: DHH family phosphoesterase [Bacillus amyloliquefaciens group]|uniref:DHH family phosphoesterase n=1 Tax=Bacillus amyloliquefaciens group TaxID=1938374 RepID=UPI0006A8F6C2|nr:MULTISPECIES: DHH family phosphoesterase [Bacillus amyloliquefaciens group]MCE4147642.1 DHH family phosphoesterase [Bacillus velezensis]NRS35026.1 DHH family phosphoesterase [Bacillus velezensis]NRS43670.1 DHH family phosphoesterase [Bacillus velezensis]UYQ97141.1 DHH family phosphoesterase [Bacillus velezensis]CUB39259.1 Bifunctional oligoribonuclease and PAP phosphatase NrnA [Bacillus amyloliquefaciens]